MAALTFCWLALVAIQIRTTIGDVVKQRESHNGAWYVDNRRRGFCDRIFLAGPKKDAVTPYFYKAFSGSPIHFSDHDAVIGYSKVDGLKIVTLTWNIGVYARKKRSLSDWKKVIASAKSQFSDSADNNWEEVDLFFIGIQEAPHNFKKDIELIYNAVKEARSDASWKHVMIKKGPTSLFWLNRAYDFDVISTVIYNEETVHYEPNIEEKFLIKQGFFKDLGGTKSATIIGSFYNSTHANTDRVELAFANTHLPVKKGQTDYGLTMRVKGLRRILKKYNKAREATEFSGLPSKGVLFLLGDLNFRRMNDDSEQDQFDVFRTSVTFPKLQEWKELKDREFAETCKRKTLAEFEAAGHVL